MSNPRIAAKTNVILGSLHAYAVSNLEIKRPRTGLAAEADACEKTPERRNAYQGHGVDSIPKQQRLSFRGLTSRGLGLLQIQVPGPHNTGRF